MFFFWYTPFVLTLRTTNVWLLRKEATHRIGFGSRHIGWIRTTTTTAPIQLIN